MVKVRQVKPVAQTVPLQTKPAQAPKCARFLQPPARQTFWYVCPSLPHTSCRLAEHSRSASAVTLSPWPALSSVVAFSALPAQLVTIHANTTPHPALLRNI